MIETITVPLGVGIGRTVGGGSGIFDAFERGTPDVINPIGGGWVDLASLFPTQYDPVGIINGKVTIRELARATAAGVGYVPDPGSDYDDYLNHPELILPGIGGAFKETGRTQVACKVRWTGLHSLTHHTEATPGVCITPGTDEMGFGSWPGEFEGFPALFFGSVGTPPEDFGDYLIDGAGFAHTDGQPRDIVVLTAPGGVAVTVWVDGVQAPAALHGLDPIPIPAALHGSTKHGFFIDQHMIPYVDDAPSIENMHAAPGIENILISW